MIYDPNAPILSAPDPTLKGEPQLLIGTWWRAWRDGTVQLITEGAAPRELGDDFLLVEAPDANGAKAAAQQVGWPDRVVLQEDDGFAD